MDKIFRISLLVSLSIHAIAFSPWAGLNLFKKSPQMKNDIEVYYLESESIKESHLENIPKIYDIKKDDIKTITDKQKEDKNLESSENAASNVPSDIADNLEEYIQYYELIREKIKQIVFSKYTQLKNRGEVTVEFVLDKHGRLTYISCISGQSTKENSIINAALRSIKDASPFPPFPPKLNKDYLSFSISIVFK